MANDTDQSKASSHHTLGVRSTQASPGDHTHDGSTSLSLSGLYMDLSTTQTAAGQKTFTGKVFITQAAGAPYGYLGFNQNSGGFEKAAVGLVPSAGIFLSDAAANDLVIVAEDTGGAGAIRFAAGGATVSQVAITPSGVLHGERIEVTGPTAWFNFQDRATGQQFAWYSSGNIARLRDPNAGADIFTIDTASKLTVATITSPVNIGDGQVSKSPGFPFSINSGLTSTGALAGSNLVTDTTYTPAWYDNSGGSPTAFTGTGSFRFGQYQRVGKSIIGDAYITVGSGGGITAGKISFDLPVSVSGSFPGGMVGVWYTGNGDQGFIKSGYNVTKCDLVHADGTNYTATPTNGQQFVCRFHYIGN